MRFWSIGVLAMLVAFSSVGIPRAHAVTLVQDGQAKATIVIRASAVAAEPMPTGRNATVTTDGKIKLAALDLQKYIQRMSGAELPIASDEQAVAGPVILVGASKRTEAGGFKIPSGLTNQRNEEAYTIIARGDTLVLAGNDEGPYVCTYYAVAEWLNRQGVHWIMPGEMGDVVPARKTLVQEDIEFVDRPSFRFRTWWCNQKAEMGVEEGLWKIRNKMQVADSQLIGIPGDSWLRQYMPDASLRESQPELFGRRFDGSLDPHMPNLSNPDAAKAVADKVIAKLRQADEKGQPIHSLGFAPDDGLPMDFTPKTMNELNQGIPDWVGREGVPTELSISEEWFAFMNRVCEEVAKVYPDVIITTNGYANRANPPVGMKLHPNLGVMYAYIWADTLKPFNHPRSWHGEVVGAQMKRWAELSSHVFLYEYHLTMLVTLLTPVPQVQKMAVNYPLMKQWGVVGFFNEARQPYMEEGIVTRYIRSKLMWNADADVDELLDVYFTNWYGPAAKPAAAYWKAIEDCLLASPLLGHEDRILPFVYTPQLLSQLEELTQQAEQLAKEEPYATRVRVDRLTLEHLKCYMAYKDAEFDGRFGDAADQLQKLIDLRMAINAISPFLAMPPSTTGIERYYSGDFYWGAIQRRDYFQQLHDKTSGKTGDLVALAPRVVKFALDEAAVGKDLGWFAPDFDRSDWRNIDTCKPFYIQGDDMLSEKGVPYAGKMWYVFEVDVPANAAGKPIKLMTPFVTCQAWAWVNGEYAGSRKYLEAYISPAPMELDVTHLVKPGQKNTVAVWVSTGVGRTQAPDGFLGRLLLYSPKPEPASQPNQ